MTGPVVVDAQAASTAGGVGKDVARPDGEAKVRGRFAYSSDLRVEGMLAGSTVRSTHPHARVVRVDTTAALRLPGVHAVLTCEDVTGRNCYGIEVADQPVLAVDRVRYQGEPVAVVAADDPETARRAAALVQVEYDVLAPVTDPHAAMRSDAAKVHPDGNVAEHVRIRRGDEHASADVVVRGTYETGMQDQAFLGPESGLAVPAVDGGVDLFVATQWLHLDREQIAQALGLEPELVRVTLAGVGGAFGAREDLSMQIHACLLALRTGRPVKMVYSREESFFGHVHRHPARLRYEHGATRDGRLVFVRAEILLDGGAYTSSTPSVLTNAAMFGTGPYVVPNVSIDGWGVYTNNPPCGAMRGFGAVQCAFAYESQMDRLAAAVNVDKAEIRIRNGLASGDRTPTGQVVDSITPVSELVRRLRDRPLPGPADADPRRLPGGIGNTTHGEGVVRGVGYGVGIKNVCYTAGFDDYATARVRLELLGGEPVARVHTAAVEVGQGLVTVQTQVVRTELGVDRVVLEVPDTRVGDAGSTSASRQTYMSAGALRAACQAVAAVVLRRAAQRSGIDVPGLRLQDGVVLSADGAAIAELRDLLHEPVDETVEWRHRPTAPIDAEDGQGSAHVQLALAAHRAVVDVDTDLGLVKVVALDCAQDVGIAVNPRGVVGQILGASAQGLGLALMEEVRVVDGVVKNPSFADYLIPTILDMPQMNVDVLELADPTAPYGIRGVGEPALLSATPAIVAAVRDATGTALTRVPVRPDDIVGAVVV